MPPERFLRILAISPYAAYPPYGGGKLRVFHLLDEWLRVGHRVTLWMVPSDEAEPGWPGETRPELRGLPARTRKGLRAKLDAVRSRLPEEVWARPADAIDWQAEDLGPFDVAVLFQAHVGRFAAPLLRAGLPAILDAHNVEAEIAAVYGRLRETRLGRTRARVDAGRWRRFERSLIRSVTRTVAVSGRDAAEFRKLVPAASIVVRPSGADLRTFAFRDHAANYGDRLIMTGTLGYMPNLDAANWMIDEILPRVRRVRPGARLVLVGSGVTDLFRSRMGGSIEVVERVPDIGPYLDESDLFVAPLRHGGGTRLKLLEAFAAGLPTVATTLAAAGIDVRPGIDLGIADDADAFASEIIRVLGDPATRVAMAASARRLVEERYDWRAIAAEYERDLFEVARAETAERTAPTGPRPGSHPY